MSILLQVMRNDGYHPAATSEGSLEEKRKRAIEWMGSRWLYHPEYIYNPKHRIYK